VEYLKEVESVQKKINAATLYPYQFVKEAYGANSNENAKSLDVLWNALPDYNASSEENSIAVVDTSGSMEGTPIYVAISLGIYMAERAKGPFKDHFLTFSAEPKMQKIQGSNIVRKVGNMKMSEWCMNTNLEKVFDLILNSGIQNNIPENEMVDKLYIISDMQFDQCITNANDQYFRSIQEKFEKAGYQMPQLVFWNVDARDNKNVPMSMDDRGFLNVSGFSPSIFETLMNGKMLNAYEMMMEVINSPRYQEIVV
jgi:hypothetical protein